VTQVASGNLADSAQLELFPAPQRDWRPLLGTALPALTPAARRLVGEFRQLARDQSWDEKIRDTNLRVLRILVAWLGAAAPVTEADIRAVAGLRRSLSGHRVTRFLDARGMLVPDPLPQASMDEAAVHRLAGTVPACFRTETSAWIRVLRGEGTRPSPVMSWRTIRRYAGAVLPSLHQWASEQITSLREVTTEDVTTAIARRPRPSGRTAHTGLRSLFRALKRERLIFRDPARTVTMHASPALPRPLPASQLTGLLDRAPTPMAAAAAALVAIHAVRPAELHRLQAADLDRQRGQLTIRRPGRSRTVFLDELTLQLLTAWLRERHRRWPASTNPHLLVSRRTAMSPDGPPVSKYCLNALFRKTGVMPGRLWTDRILDEAARTADPVHLMHLYGLSAATAIKYVRTAHPQRFAIDPASP
jgi:integrase